MPFTTSHVDFRNKVESIVTEQLNTKTVFLIYNRIYHKHEIEFVKQKHAELEATFTIDEGNEFNDYLRSALLTSKTP